MPEFLSSKVIVTEEAPTTRIFAPSPAAVTGIVGTAARGPKGLGARVGAAGYNRGYSAGQNGVSIGFSEIIYGGGTGNRNLYAAPLLGASFTGFQHKTPDLIGELAARLQRISPKRGQKGRHTVTAVTNDLRAAIAALKAGALEEARAILEGLLEELVLDTDSDKARDSGRRLRGHASAPSSR